MSYKDEFLEFAIQQDVLRFGEFTLKSGRVSPYFFNAGRFNSGGALSRLGRFYARAIQDSGIAFDMLFGPAYKGIPLVAATAIAFFDEFGMDVPYAFNRKEAKTHGEGGNIIGAPLQGRVLIIDDVITAGLAIRGAVKIISSAEAEPVGVAISLNRQERGKSELSAIQEVEQDYGMQVISIVNMDDLLAYVRKESSLASLVDAIEDYRLEYGVDA